MNQQITDCQNCGAALGGDYCSACGQRADEPRRVVIGLVQDFLVDTMAIDGKLARSIGLLLSRPGRLARLYLDGKRVKYSPPFRLYLFGSVFFFLAAFAMIGAPQNNMKDAIDNGAPAINEDVIATVESEDPEAAAQLRELNEEIKDKSKNEAGDNVPFTEQEWESVDYNGPDWAEPHMRRLFEATQRMIEDPRLFMAQTKETLPRVMLLVPVMYALVLMLLYVYRRKFYVYDHFVVSLYMHAALYAYLLLALAISFIPVVGPWVAVLPLAWGWLQPFVMFRQVYRSNWVSVFLKWAISIAIYFTMLALIVTFGVSYSLYQS